MQKWFVIGGATALVAFVLISGLLDSHPRGRHPAPATPQLEPGRFYLGGRPDGSSDHYYFDARDSGARRYVSFRMTDGRAKAFVAAYAERMQLTAYPAKGDIPPAARGAQDAPNWDAGHWFVNVSALEGAYGKYGLFCGCDKERVYLATWQ